jgi:ribose 5-phosphate isomerase RpiB
MIHHQCVACLTPAPARRVQSAPGLFFALPMKGGLPFRRIVEIFLSTPCGEDRHTRRVEKLREFESHH